MFYRLTYRMYSNTIKFMIQQLDSMLTIATYKDVFPDKNVDEQLNIEDGILWLVTKVTDGIFYISGEWGLKVECISLLLTQIKEHITSLHNNKIFVRIEGFPKLDENGHPELEIFCRYLFRRDDVYVEKVETIQPTRSPIDKKKYKIKSRGKT